MQTPVHAHVLTHSCTLNNVYSHDNSKMSVYKILHIPFFHTSNNTPATHPHPLKHIHTFTHTPTPIPHLMYHNIYIFFKDDDDEVMLNVFRCQLTY